MFEGKHITHGGVSISRLVYQSVNNCHLSLVIFGIPTTNYAHVSCLLTLVHDWSRNAADKYVFNY